MRRAGPEWSLGTSRKARTVITTGATEETRRREMRRAGESGVGEPVARPGQ